MNPPESSLGRRDFLRATGIAGLGLGFKLQRGIARALLPGPGATEAKAEMMPAGEIVVSLDIGARKIRAVVGERQADGAIRILGIGQGPSLGVPNGVVEDSVVAGRCVRHALADAEEKIGVMLGSTHLAVIAGSRIHGIGRRADNSMLCLTKRGVKVKEVVFQSMARGHGAPIPDQTKPGAFVIDIGAGRTSHIAFADGGSENPGRQIGGRHYVTNDFSLAFAIPLECGERLKIEKGSVWFGQSISGERIVIEDEAGATREIERELLKTIVRPRLRSRFEGLKDSVNTGGERFDLVDLGVHLAGGFSMLRGIDELARELFGIPAQNEPASGGLGPDNQLNLAQCACVIGLLSLEISGSTRLFYRVIPEPL